MKIRGEKTKDVTGESVQYKTIQDVLLVQRHVLINHILSLVLTNLVTFLFCDDRPRVAVSFSALACALNLVLQGSLCCLSLSLRERLSIHSRSVYFLTFAYIVSIFLFVGFVSGAVSSEARQGG